ncbi:MAG: Na+/H+ antiporter NhaA [Thermoleophilia bacterium]
MSNEGRGPEIRRPWSRSERPVPRRVLRPLHEFMRQEASGGIALLAATVAALVWANLAGGSYDDLWGAEVVLRIGDHGIAEDLRHVVNDGLMALFFLVIGLEVKRELVVGELSSRRAALLPAFAAVGGMVLPALIFTGVVGLGGGGDAGGWGIPMATDVAFAVGALAALGRRVPPGLVAFLLGVAVIDDIGAVIVVALFYTGDLSFAWLAATLVGLAAIAALQRVGVRHLAPYVALGIAVWYATYQSGVHATIAAVAIGLLTPARPFQRPAAVRAEASRIAAAVTGEDDRDASGWRRLSWLSREAISPLARVEHGLHQWSSFVVLPIFALANAGIVLDGGSLDAATETPIALAVAVALLAGKTLGLTLGTALAVGLRLSDLPRGAGWSHIAGVGALAGIGFTVSLFITELAYDDPDVIAAAKIGILGGSAVAAAAGTLLLLRAGRRAARAGG